MARGNALMTLHLGPALEPAPRFSLGPLTYVIAVSEWAKWLAHSAPGDEMIYAHGLVPPRSDAVWRAAGMAADDALVTLYTRKQDGRTFWMAQKCRIVARTDKSADWRISRASVAIDEMLRAAFEHGAVLPANAAIAGRTGLSRDKAGRLLHERAQVIGLRVVQSAVGGLRTVQKP